MKTFKPYSQDQIFLLPPDLREWLPEGHLALFLSDVVDQLDLSAILSTYTEERGQPPYHPVMMVKLILYGYCTGKPSSRKIEKATYESIPFRVLSANQHPDHDSIAEFRRRHLKALAGLFLQVLRLCQAAGLVAVGRVALDGTKVQANASKHKAMSYERMLKTEKQLQAQIAELLKQAEETDTAEDSEFGKGKRGDELPDELARRRSRLKKIQEAKAALEKEAREKAAAKAEKARQRLAEREKQEAETGRKTPGRAPEVPDPEQAVPEPKAQRNFTDPESRIMKDGATKGFTQAYNGQIVVTEGQIIVAAETTQDANDKKQLVPMLEAAGENLGQMPTEALADAGYFSEENVTAPELKEVDLYVPPDRQKHEPSPETPVEAAPGAETGAKAAMRVKVSSPSGKAVYAKRKAMVEPVFGQIKEARGFRRFSFRGREKVGWEWKLICLTHNLLKLFVGKVCPREGKIPGRMAQTGHARVWERFFGGVGEVERGSESWFEGFRYFWAELAWGGDRLGGLSETYFPTGS
jgi:transposase